MSFWRTPRPVWARRVIFQIHAWTGLLTGAYLLLIGATGALLMFRADLQRRAYPSFFTARVAQARVADPQRVILELERAYPGFRFSGIDYPHARRGTFLAYVASGSDLRTVFLDSATGRVIGELPQDGWIQRLQELHFNLLAGARGYVINGIGASSLLLMCVTGVVVWWPGISRLRRALVVQRDRGWRRTTWELHGAVGIWCSVLLFAWSLSGIYFSFPVPFRNAVGRLTRLTPYAAIESGPPSGSPVPLPSDLVRRAQERVPGAQVARFGVPAGARGSYSVTLARVRHGDGDGSDEVTVYFDRYTGAELQVVAADRGTVGDRFLTWLGRLHVGNFGGVVVRLTWFVAGLALPLLFVSGTVMWWNRFARPRLPMGEREHAP